LRTLILWMFLAISVSLAIFLVRLIVAPRQSYIALGIVAVLLILCSITASQFWLSSLRPPWLWFWYRRVAFWLLTLAGRNPLCASPDEAILYAKAAKHYPMYAAIAKKLRLIETDAEGRMLWQTPLGAFWIPRGASRKWLVALIAEQLQNAYAFKEQMGANGAVVFDCGANVGDFSRLALNNGAAMVIAIEPSPETAVCLRRNLADAIASRRAVIYENGVWSCEAKLFLETANAEIPGAHRLSTGPDTTEQGTWVKLTTIDTIVDELRLDRVDFIKMDVEGAEQNALLGGARSIARHQPKLAVATEHTDDRVANSRAVLEIVKKIDPAYASRSVCSTIVSSPSKGYLIVPEIIVFETP
jgi:FkbM family methyltransferase